MVTVEVAAVAAAVVAEVHEAAAEVASVALQLDKAADVAERNQATTVILMIVTVRNDHANVSVVTAILQTISTELKQLLTQTRSLVEWRRSLRSTNDDGAPSDTRSSSTSSTGSSSSGCPCFSWGTS